MEQYILLYGNKKPEDIICIKNMFENIQLLELGWTDKEYHNNMEIIDKYIKEGIGQVIFFGLEIGWDKLVKGIKKKNPSIKVKVICNTQDSLLYYDYERENFLKLLRLTKEGFVENIAFLRKGQYETYKNLGYPCSYLQENYVLEKSKNVKIEKTNKGIDLGIYPLNYTWDKNIFNQLCIAKFIENCHVNYYKLEERMEDFLKTMEINSSPEQLERIEDSHLIQTLCKNDVIVATSFTEYVHPVFFISMELGIPCLIGNHSDFFVNNEELQNYVVTTAEDNPIINAKMVENMVKNKTHIQKLYETWKINYNKQAKESIEKFVNCEK